MSREEALDKLSKRAYDEQTITQDFEYIATKLGITVEELHGLMVGQNKSYKDYKSSKLIIDLGVKILRIFGVQKAIIR
jgi:hypothetical protein